MSATALPRSKSIRLEEMRKKIKQLEEDTARAEASNQHAISSWKLRIRKCEKIDVLKNKLSGPHIQLVNTVPDF